MEIDFIKRPHINTNNFILEIRVEKKIAGTAYFFENNNEPGIFCGRVDLKEKYKKQGLATLALNMGDKVIRDNYSNALRLFNDTNNYGYKKYTDGIRDDQIIDISDNGVLFKP